MAGVFIPVFNVILWISGDLQGILPYRANVDLCFRWTVFSTIRWIKMKDSANSGSITARCPFKHNAMCSGFYEC